MLMILSLVKTGYRSEIERFFSAVDPQAQYSQPFTVQALSKARKKISEKAFIELCRELVRHIESSPDILRWNGFRLLALDGTQLRLPDVLEIVDHFGCHAECPMARVSQLYDPLNRLTVSAVITKNSESEREHAHQLMLDLMPGDLVIMDRGYPAIWLFRLIESLGAHFCVRMPGNWKEVRKFIESDKKDCIVSIDPTQTAIRECTDMGMNTGPFRLRLLKIGLSSGETEVLATSLTDFSLYKYDEFAGLYHLRWGIEEDYKIMKCRIEIENFSGKSVLSILQDFYSAVFTKNLTAFLSQNAIRTLLKIGIKKKYRHSINFRYALSKVRSEFASLFLSTLDVAAHIIDSINSYLIRFSQPVREGRSFLRNKKSCKSRTFPMAYKAIA